MTTHLLVATSTTGAIASAVRADEPLLAARSGSVVERLSNARRRLEQHTDPDRPLGEQASSGRRTRIKRRPAEAQLVAVRVPVDRFADAIGIDLDVVRLEPTAGDRGHAGIEIVEEDLTTQLPAPSACSTT